MLAALLISTAMVAQQTPPAQVATADLAAYQEAKAQTGRDADAQVRLALWCEAHGLTAERAKHLTLAVLINPDHQAARGLLGMVASQGKWKKPEDVRAEIDRDPKALATMQEYLQRRAATADTAEAQVALARWCDQNGLADQASAHYKAVVRLDPGREAVWKKLGYKRSNGRWVQAEDLAAEKADAEQQKHADKSWKPILEKYRDALSSKDRGKRQQAEVALDQITDPRAVPMVWNVFVRDDSRLQQRAVLLLAQIDGPSASRALTSLGVYSEFPEVRGRAVEVLARRDPRDFLEPLLDLIHKPFRYQVKRFDGPNSQGVLFVEGEQFNIQRFYGISFNLAPDQIPRRIFTSDIPLQTGFNSALIAGTGWNGALSSGTAVSTPGLSPLQIPGVPALAVGSGADQKKGASSSVATGLAMDTQRAAIQADQRVGEYMSLVQDRLRQVEQSLEQDVAFVENVNKGIRAVNDRVMPLVNTVTGRNYGDDPDAWKTWWNDEIGYAYQSSTPVEKPTYYDFVQVQVGPSHSSCFVAGTPVQTLAGPAPIESIRIGDKVLSQNVTTGALTYQPVLVVHRNAPAATLRLTLGSETVVATGIHRFWKPGKGWVMARDLKPGDSVRTLGGTLAVEAVSPGEVQPVFNLDVAENRNFFVGRNGFLVYDFSIVQPAVSPFDASSFAALDGANAP